MSNLTIGDPPATRIRELARQENRDPEAVLADMLASYTPRLASVPSAAIPEPPPRPHESLTDDWIDVPDDVEDKVAYREAARALAPKLYEMARDYWRRVGDTERLALTDEALDEVFWLIDDQGIPRFRSEKDSVELPPDPLEALVGLFADSDVADASTTVREVMAERYRKKAADVGID